MNILNTLSLSKGANGKPECKCSLQIMSIYVIRRTNHANPAVHNVYIYLYDYDK